MSGIRSPALNHSEWSRPCSLEVKERASGWSTTNTQLWGANYISLMSVSPFLGYPRPLQFPRTNDKCNWFLHLVLNMLLTFLLLSVCYTPHWTFLQVYYINPNPTTRQSTYTLNIYMMMSLVRPSMSSSPGPSKRKSMKKWLKNLIKQGPDQVLSSSSSQTHESTSTPDSPHPSNLAENFKILGRFSLSILPKIAGCVDENPAKMAFNILNLIMEVRKVGSVSGTNKLNASSLTMDISSQDINDNKDELQRIIEETLLLLSTVLVKMETGSNPQSIVSQTVEQYKR